MHVPYIKKDACSLDLPDATCAGYGIQGQFTEEERRVADADYSPRSPESPKEPVKSASLDYSSPKVEKGDSEDDSQAP